jgi:hypothetical protein
MTEWYYKASEPSSAEARTQTLLDDFGFIVRPAFYRRKNGTTARVPNVEGVGLGDVIHVYSSDAEGPASLGSWVVSGSRRHARPELFGGGVTRTSLHLAQGALAETLEEFEGYEPDPEVGGHTGWFVRSADSIPPPFDPNWFPRQAILAKAL